MLVNLEYCIIFKYLNFVSLQISGRPVDLELARRQHADLVAAVRGLNIDVLELPPDETNALSVFTQDLAVVVNGIALMCRPVNSTRKPEVHYII